MSMDHITLNVALSDFSTHGIIIQMVAQSCSNQFLATKQNTVHIWKMVFISNNTRKLSHFIFQRAVISVETKNLDSGIHEM